VVARPATGAAERARPGGASRAPLTPSRADSTSLSRRSSQASRPLAVAFCGGAARLIRSALTLNRGRLRVARSGRLLGRRGRHGGARLVPPCRSRGLPPHGVRVATNP
jgi:hypothetical protein